MANINEIKYVSTETWELLTIKQLQDFYANVVVKEDGNEYGSFNYWLSCCMTRNNGTLEEVQKVTEKFYKTKDGHYYSTNEQMLYDINNTLSDIYFDVKYEILDDLSMQYSDGCHSFEELTHQYFIRLDNYNEDELMLQLCKCYEDLNNIEELKNLVLLLNDSVFFE